MKTKTWVATGIFNLIGVAIMQAGNTDIGPDQMDAINQLETPKYYIDAINENLQVGLPEFS